MAAGMVATMVELMVLMLVDYLDDKMVASKVEMLDSS